jgi:hypothetical protein
MVALPGRAVKVLRRQRQGHFIAGRMAVAGRSAKGRTAAAMMV